LLDTIIEDFYNANRYIMYGNPTRRVAGARAYDELGMAGGGAPSGGAGIGAALGMGAALPFISDKVPPQPEEDLEEKPPTTPEVEQQKKRFKDIEMGLGSRLLRDPRFRRLYNMTEEQLAEEPWSKEKEEVLRIKGLEVQKPQWFGTSVPINAGDERFSRPLLPGYVEILVSDKKGSVDSQHWEKSKAIDVDKYVDLMSKGYSESEARKEASQPPAGHVRGFAPNPDTFLIFEAQKGRESHKDTEYNAIDAAIEYARKAGYKNIGIIDADSAASIQGHKKVEDWIKNRYDKKYVEYVSKKLKQSPTIKEFGFGDKLSDSGQFSRIVTDKMIKEYEEEYDRMWEEFRKKNKKLIDKASEYFKKREEFSTYWRNLLEEMGKKYDAVELAKNYQYSGGDIPYLLEYYRMKSINDFPKHWQEALKYLMETKHPEFPSEEFDAYTKYKEIESKFRETLPKPPVSDKPTSKYEISKNPDLVPLFKKIKYRVFSLEGNK
jgi:ribonuclease HI